MTTKERQKEWCRKNPEKRRAIQIRWRLSHLESKRKMDGKWRRGHPEIMTLKMRTYRGRHPEQTIMRKVIQRIMECKGIKKNHKSSEYVGCSPGFLRNHIEALFMPGMTWENYGEWHIDHIVPLSWFPFRADESWMFVASHWTNLQPMWAKDNLTKSNRFIA